MINCSAGRAKTPSMAKEETTVFKANGIATRYMAAQETIFWLLGSNTLQSMCRKACMGAMVMINSWAQRAMIISKAEPAATRTFST
jgi:hypothetical protein